MTYASGYTEPVPNMVQNAGIWSLIFGAYSGAFTSGAYDTANLGSWAPIVIPTVCVAKRMWWANGATVNASYNVEAGIYLDAGYKPGAKLITTGSVAQGTASEVQFADITDTTLTPGLYWFYISCSTTSATFMRSSYGSTNWDELYRFQQASIGPGSAPAVATPAKSTQAYFYGMGFSTTTIT